MSLAYASPPTALLGVRFSTYLSLLKVAVMTLVTVIVGGAEVPLRPFTTQVFAGMMVALGSAQARSFELHLNGLAVMRSSQ